MGTPGDGPYEYPGQPLARLPSDMSSNAPLGLYDELTNDPFFRKQDESQGMDYGVPRLPSLSMTPTPRGSENGDSDMGIGIGSQAGVGGQQQPMQMGMMAGGGGANGGAGTQMMMQSDAMTQQAAMQGLLQSSSMPPSLLPYHHQPPMYPSPYEQHRQQQQQQQQQQQPLFHPPPRPLPPQTSASFPLPNPRPSATRPPLPPSRVAESPVEDRKMSPHRFTPLSPAVSSSSRSQDGEGGPGAGGRSRAHHDQPQELRRKQSPERAVSPLMEHWSTMASGGQAAKGGASKDNFTAMIGDMKTDVQYGVRQGIMSQAAVPSSSVSGMGSSDDDPDGEGGINSVANKMRHLSLCSDFLTAAEAALAAAPTREEVRVKEVPDIELPNVEVHVDTDLDSGSVLLVRPDGQTCNEVVLQVRPPDPLTIDKFVFSVVIERNAGGEKSPAARRHSVSRSPEHTDSSPHASGPDIPMQDAAIVKREKEDGLLSPKSANISLFGRETVTISVRASSGLKSMTPKIQSVYLADQHKHCECKLDIQDIVLYNRVGFFKPTAMKPKPLRHQWAWYRNASLQDTYENRELELKECRAAPEGRSTRWRTDKFIADFLVCNLSTALQASFELLPLSEDCQRGVIKAVRLHRADGTPGFCRIDGILNFRTNTQSQLRVQGGACEIALRGFTCAATQITASDRVHRKNMD
ncbi:unnamed protein product [Vitrella brassicaformis CCMP3155]|uniref:Uncharacterized protein n=2 Tax=Vitrella brassicaformis TaxID=1169539 RepID=A0A0G4FDK3_VITBC|nr:unnamed protein product [Vitrella brassicaformis CCMP3155]|mmetsp:Transcript_33992/g.97914  ORF Transcript_33992/g.97914 Transcript_33992/m.97914 type:complete len:692 (+) Transcript_33992:210-2285(+)|eukprot:CEM10931.1 unnamed protein product [Vitrella brassicaformis CCMP3155]